MKRTLILIVALTIAGICCVVAAYFSHFYYHRYQTAVTKLESLVSSFDTRLSILEAHKARELRPVRVWGVISTTDRPSDDYLAGLPAPELPELRYQVVGSKEGTFIRPELRLRAGSATNFLYEIEIEKPFGPVADVWLSHAAPYQDLAAFEEFRLYSSNKTNIVRLIARLKSGASVQMRFDMVVLCEK